MSTDVVKSSAIDSGVLLTSDSSGCCSDGQGVVRESLEQHACTDKYSFERLLEDVCEMRLSEYHFYQEISAICQTRMPNNHDAQYIADAVLNMLHFGMHGYSALALLHGRQDSKMQAEGLIQAADVTQGFAPAELQALGRIVQAYIHFSNTCKQRKIPTEVLWAKQLLQSKLSFSVY